MTTPAPTTEVIVLAAGKGSRLGTTGAETPKWLLEVGGRTIADRQLEAAELARAETDGAVGSVRVVTGHAEGEVARFLSERSDEDAHTIFNPHYATLNNWYSVLLALREIDHAGARLVIINGDLFAPAEWLAAFIAESAMTESESLIGVDLERRLTDESMKVSADPGPPRLIREIGKVGVDDAIGEYVGLLMVRGAVLRAFRDSLETFVGDPSHAQEWYERSIGLTAAGGTPWLVWPTPDSGWVEIDDEDDLRLASAMADPVARR
jgi:choline kinase